MSVDPVLRSRALRYVVKLAHDTGGRDPLAWPGPDLGLLRRQRELATETALEEYTALGLLDASAVAALVSDDVTAGEAVCARAARLLEARLAQDPDRAASTLAAAAAAGAVDSAAYREWIDRLEERRLGAAGAAQVRAERDRRRHRLDDLRDVVVGPAERPSGVRVASVELYADGVLVAWRAVRGFDAVTLADDAGTEYLRAGGGGSADGAQTIFVPAAPATATRLEIAVDDDRFTADLEERRVR